MLGPSRVRTSRILTRPARAIRMPLCARRCAAPWNDLRNMTGMRIDLDDIADPPADAGADAGIVRGHADVPADRGAAAGTSDSDMRRGSDSHGRRAYRGGDAARQLVRAGRGHRA